MKKISLEHSIRNIVTESVGNVNDLKTSRAPKAVFNKPVQIEPPVGEEHPGVKAMNVANQRKYAKQQDSETRDTFAEGIVDTPIKILGRIIGTEAGAAGRVAGTAAKEVEAATATAAKEAPTITPTKPVELPPLPPNNLPAVVPNKPSPAPTKPSTVPAPTKPETVPAPTKTEPSTKVATVTDVETATKTQKAPATATKTQTATAVPVPTKTKTATKTPIIPLVLPTGSGGEDKPAPPKVAPNTNVPLYLHKAGPRKDIDPVHLGTKEPVQILKRRSTMKEENQEDRKQIEFVARGKLDPKKTLGRLSAIKTRIIDEAEEIKPSKAAKVKSIVLDKKEEKLGVNPVVETDPKLKPLHMAEENLLEAPGDAAFDRYTQADVDDLIAKNPGAKNKINQKWQEAQARKSTSGTTTNSTGASSTRAPKSGSSTSSTSSPPPPPPSPQPPATTTTAPAAPESTLSKVGKGALKVMDKAAAPVTAGLDYYQRREEGQSKLKSATGAASTTAGMIAGTKAGAALGSVAGPVGTVVGGLAGAVGGAYLGGKAHDVVADTIEKSPSISQPKYEMPKPSSETGPYKTSDEDMEKLGVKKKVNESFLKILRGTK